MFNWLILKVNIEKYYWLMKNKTVLMDLKLRVEFCIEIGLTKRS